MPPPLQEKEYEVYNSILSGFKHYENTPKEYQICVIPVHNLNITPPSDSAHWDTTGGGAFSGAVRRQPHDISYIQDIFACFARHILPSICASLKDSYYYANSFPQLIDSVKLQANLPIKVISEDDYSRIINQDTLSPKYRMDVAQYMKYHRWRIKFSRVGFDSTGKYAVVFFQLMHPLGGGGGATIQLLENIGGRWTKIIEAGQTYV